MAFGRCKLTGAHSRPCSMLRDALEADGQCSHRSSRFLRHDHETVRWIGPVRSARTLSALVWPLFVTPESRFIEEEHTARCAGQISNLLTTAAGLTPDPVWVLGLPSAWPQHFVPRVESFMLVRNFRSSADWVPGSTLGQESTWSLHNLQPAGFGAQVAADAVRSPAERLTTITIATK